MNNEEDKRVREGCERERDLRYYEKEREKERERGSKRKREGKSSQ